MRRIQALDQLISLVPCAVGVGLCTPAGGHLGYALTGASPASPAFHLLHSMGMSLCLCQQRHWHCVPAVRRAAAAMRAGQLSLRNDQAGGRVRACVTGTGPICMIVAVGLGVLGGSCLCSVVVHPAAALSRWERTDVRLGKRTITNRMVERRRSHIW